jgi:N-methylhydantoinase B
MPHKIAAGHKGDMGGYAFFGTDPRTRRRFLCRTIMGGAGATERMRMVKTQRCRSVSSDVQNAPIELQELYYPVMIEQHRCGRAAAQGKFRGGWVSKSPCGTLCDAFVNINVERTLTPPWGRSAAIAASRQRPWSSRTRMMPVHG